jgi:hypothetical protein
MPDTSSDSPSSRVRQSGKLKPAFVSSQSQPLHVTIDNFVRAETDMNLGFTVNDGGLGKFHHHREAVNAETQNIVRPNRDTLYSAAVFDLDAGPVTIVLPDPGERFMSLQVVDQDHYVVAVEYGAGPRTVTREKAGTRYIFAVVRTLLDPTDPKDIDRVHTLQDHIVVSQKETGKFEVPNWDLASQKKVREALLALGATVPETKRMFGARSDVDPVRHLIGTAMGFGGNPERDATYISVTPDKNDGATNYRLTVREVPVDGFWSVTVYNAEGFFEKNDRDAYSINNITGSRSDDGSYEIRFGGCDGARANCLPIAKGWNYTVRLYRPRPEILDGTFKFPEAHAVG